MAFPRRIVHPLLSLLALAATSCSVWLPGRPVEVHHQVALPADVTATLVAAALRDELRAEAEARAAGAPVSPRADGTFAARFENGPAAQWLAVADARLRVALVDGSGRTRVDVRPPTDGAPLRGFGRGAQRVIELVVTPRAAGCRLTCRGSRELAALVDEVVARTLRLATHDEAGGPGAAEPNLVAWRLGRLIVRAADCEQEDGRAALLRAASRLPDAPCEVFEQLGDLFAAHGQSDRAVANFRRAALRASDPRRRAELAQRAADATDGRRRRDNLRSEAMQRLVAGDVPGAEQRLHTARRVAPQPVVDYHLLSAVHRHRGDQMAALAAELLAREYRLGADEAEAPDEVDVWARSMTEWSRRLTVGAHPVRASSQLYGVQRLGTAPPR